MHHRPRLQADETLVASEGKGQYVISVVKSDDFHDPRNLASQLRAKRHALRLLKKMALKSCLLKTIFIWRMAKGT